MSKGKETLNFSHPTPVKAALLLFSPVSGPHLSPSQDMQPQRPHLPFNRPFLFPSPVPPLFFSLLQSVLFFSFSSLFFFINFFKKLLNNFLLFFVIFLSSSLIALLAQNSLVGLVTSLSLVSALPHPSSPTAKIQINYNGRSARRPLDCNLF